MSKIFRRQKSELHQDLPQAATAALLFAGREFQLGVGHHARRDQLLAQRQLVSSSCHFFGPMKNLRFRLCGRRPPATTRQTPLNP